MNDLRLYKIFYLFRSIEYIGKIWQFKMRHYYTLFDISYSNNTRLD